MANGSLKLSATEWREMTKLPDAVILELMSMQNSIENIVNNFNIIINNVSSDTSGAQNSAQINRLKSVVMQMQEQIGELGAVTSKLAYLKRDTQTALLANQEQQAGTAGLDAHSRALIHKNATALANLQQELAGG